MLSATVLCLLPTLLSTAAALPSTPATTLQPCTNHLSNPSFESSAITPWLPIVESAWSATRGVFPRASPNTHGKYFYRAHATSTVESSLAISQSGIALQVGSTVDCYAWVAGWRSENVTRVDVFLDGVACGSVEMGAGEGGWKRVGGKVGVVGGVGGVGSTMAVIAASEGAGGEGWDIEIDELGVVSC